MIRTDGTWDPLEEKIIFLPGNFGGGTGIFSARSLDVHRGTELEPLWHQALELFKDVSKLFSLLDVSPPSWEKSVGNQLKNYGHVFMDSGVFGLAMQHARKHGLSHNDALNVPPEQVDGWDDFLALYIRVCSTYKDRFWGYAELDLGGTDRKIKTRALLEAQGLRPMPVWHPLTDGLEYGEFLMKTYDRICVGNLVKSDEESRKTVLRMVARVKGDRPTPWIHALGLAPVPFAISFPINSLDAMTWMSAMMYPKRFTYALFQKFEVNAPRLYAHRNDYFMAATMLQKQVIMTQQNWRSYESAKRRAANH